MPATLRSTNTPCMRRRKPLRRAGSLPCPDSRESLRQSATVSSPSLAKRAMRMGTIVSGQESRHCFRNLGHHRGGRWVVEVYQGLCSALAGGVCADAGACDAALHKYTLHAQTKASASCRQLAVSGLTRIAPAVGDGEQSIARKTCDANGHNRLRTRKSSSLPEPRASSGWSLGRRGISRSLFRSCRRRLCDGRSCACQRCAPGGTQMPATLRSANTPCMRRRKPLRRAGSLPCPDSRESLRQSATVSSPSLAKRAMRMGTIVSGQESRHRFRNLGHHRGGRWVVVSGQESRHRFRNLRYIKVFVPLLPEASVRTQVLPAMLRATNTPRVRT